MTAEPNKSPAVTLAMLRAELGHAFESLFARLEALRTGAELPALHVPDTCALRTLADIFHLDAEEIEVVTLAAGAELDPRIGAAIHGLTGNSSPDLGLAERLTQGAWDSLCPEAPLRHWRIVSLAGNGPIRARNIRLDERIVHFLLGTTYLDNRLEGIVHHLAPTGGSHPIHERIVAAWNGSAKPAVQLLAGRDRILKRQISAHATDVLGLRLFRIDAGDISTDWTQFTALAIFIDRELALSGGAILIEATNDTASAAARFADLLRAPTLISAPDPDAPDRSPRLRIDMPEPDRTARRALWQEVLGPRATELGPNLDRIAEQFALDPSSIQAVADTAQSADQIWNAAREQGRRRMDDLADRIEVKASWDDLVLPPDQLSILRDLAHHLREAWVVNQTWGWAEKNSRGLGVAALFAGASGTGKTLAAEVIAGALRLDLYRIDLSQVVSKYIGETEKNLARIFSAAEDGGAILLFDEADALFGKRSEVKDSHDRYANVEVSYLLQRMEAYRGLAILTTNQKSAVDQAFLRRLRYVVTFAFPDAAARKAIWAQIFPKATPTEGLDPGKLSRLSLTGGSIRSIALNASFLAAGACEPVKMNHILRATRREYAKLEKPLAGSELEAFR